MSVKTATPMLRRKVCSAGVLVPACSIKTLLTKKIVALNIEQACGKAPKNNAPVFGAVTKPMSDVCRRTQIFYIVSSAYLKYAYFARAILDGMIKDMMRNTLIGGLILAIMSMYLLMNSTTPSEAHPIVILSFFLLLYISVLIIIMGALVVGSRLIARLPSRRQRQVLAYDRAYMVASLLALAPVMLIAMNSVGGISLREVLLVVVFEIVALFYLWKRR